jgi:hypothetical protein
MSLLLSKSSIRLFSLLIISIFMVSNCKDSTKPDPDPPVLPPLSAIEMDLSSLTNSGTPKLALGKTFDNNSVMVGTNWVYAAGTVGFWTTLTGITLSVPTAAFVATINEEPEYLGELRWKWTKNFQVLFFQYTAELYGELDNSVIDWEMHISKAGVYQDFLWFTGQSNLDGSGGTWTFYESYENQVELVEVDWNYYSVGVGNLHYQVIKEMAENKNSYIFYEFDNDEDYNAEYTLYNSVNANTINVEWHRINRNGRVKSPVNFGDELWHCWDENRDNIECP